MMKNDSLRSLIRLYVEATITPDVASKADLALFTGKIDEERKYVLYSPENMMFYFKKNISDINKKTKKIGQKVGGDFHISEIKELLVKHWPESYILGYISADQCKEPCHGADEVKLAAAEKGYGPMMYDIAMALSPTKTLTSDRFSVSPSAEKIWAYYKNNRKDVTPLKFDDALHPITSDPNDDCVLHGSVSPDTDKPVDYAYKTKSSANTGELQNNHLDFCDNLILFIKDASKGNIQLTQQRIERSLTGAATQFFREKYHA